MSNGPLIPGDEQARAIQEALKTLRAAGGALREILGTVPEDIVGYLGGDWLRIRRAENVRRLVEDSQARLKARGKEPQNPSISIAIPLLVAAADEDRDELRDVWARLLAAAADPERAKFFRQAFIEVAKKLDPLDAAVLAGAQERAGMLDGNGRNQVAGELNVTRDQVDVSAGNLLKLELLAGQTLSNPPDSVVSAFGREFLRALAD
jgi:hypothetical protein